MIGMFPMLPVFAFVMLCVVGLLCWRLYKTELAEIKLMDREMKIDSYLRINLIWIVCSVLSLLFVFALVFVMWYVNYGQFGNPIPDDGLRVLLINLSYLLGFLVVVVVVFLLGVVLFRKY